MPYSSLEGKAWALSVIHASYPDASAPLKFLDIGAGGGTWLDLIKPHFMHSHWTAIEVWEPNIARFALRDRYDEVIVRDARETYLDDDFDIVILGDVLEHMSQEDALKLWRKCLAITRARHGLVIGSMPCIHYPQGAHDGNPYERHIKDDWTADEINKTFIPNWISVGSVVANFIRESR